MKTHGWTLLTLALCAALAGCGGTETTRQTAQGEPPAGVTSVKATESGKSPADAEDDVVVEQLPIGAAASPAEVVTFFLDSLRAGNKGHVAATLTKKARLETSRADLVVQPIGSPDARYEVGSVDYVGGRKEGAHVQSTWTETDDSGANISYDVIWVLRKQEAGWRIAGMATQMGDGEPPEFLNFENPKEMLRKLQENSEGSASNEEANTASNESSAKSR